MRNMLLLLLLVLVAGFASGYFVGDYRGKDARDALKKAIETGKVLDREHEATIASLKKDLDDIKGKYKRDMDVIRQDYEARSTEWQSTKAGLDDTIKSQKVKLAEPERHIDELTIATGKSTGAERERLKNEIARLRKLRAELQREMEGNQCLQTQVPRSVLSALGGTARKGDK